MTIGLFVLVGVLLLVGLLIIDSARGEIKILKVLIEQRRVSQGLLVNRLDALDGRLDALREKFNLHQSRMMKHFALDGGDGSNDALVAAIVNPCYGGKTTYVVGQSIADIYERVKRLESERRESLNPEPPSRMTGMLASSLVGRSDLYGAVPTIRPTSDLYGARQAVDDSRFELDRCDDIHKLTSDRVEVLGELMTENFLGFGDKLDEADERLGALAAALGFEEHLVEEHTEFVKVDVCDPRRPARVARSRKGK